MKYDNKITFKVHGLYAMFSDPILRVGGEKSSYMVPTYQALKGIAEAIYWKPTFIWVIDKCRVMKKIRTQTKSIKNVKYNVGGNDLSIYTYLYDVEYRVEAHFEWNETRDDLISDRNEHKHYLIAKRMLHKGGKRDVFLGTRECGAYVEPCIFEEGEGYYDHTENMFFGAMFHSYDYPSETGKKDLCTNLTNITMQNGVIHFVRPENCTVKRKIKTVGAFHPKANDFQEDIDAVEEDSL